MDWVEQRAYSDGRFLLEHLMSRISSDVHAMNRLPAARRFGRRFVLRRDKGGSEYRVAMHHSPDPHEEPDTVLHFRRCEGYVRVRLTTGAYTNVMIRPAEDGTVELLEGDTLETATSMALWELSRQLLSPLLADGYS